MELHKGQNIVSAEVEVYRIENLTFTYPERESSALIDIDLTIRRGEFATLCGPSGCGKTTLLRQLKPSMRPHGIRTGGVFFSTGADMQCAPLHEMSPRDQASKIGFVQQSPENQIVTDKVWHELAFGLESLGIGAPEIRRRVAEMASFFGIQTWFYKPVTELSGGQKQLLNLASVMAMQPAVLILDEPTSQLDPIAASEFLATVSKLNRELGLTIILTEHRLEEAFPLSDRAIVMDGGRVVADGTPREAALQLRDRGHGMFLAMPTAMRIWEALSDAEPDTKGLDSHCVVDGREAGECPVTVRDGVEWLRQFMVRNSQYTVKGLPEEIANNHRAPKQGALEWDDVWFKYGKSGQDVLKGLSFEAYYGEITAILGGNGAGKTTALSLVAGLNTPYRGKVRINGEVVDKIPRLFDGLLGVLPQNPQALFVKKTLREDLLEILSERKLSRDEKQKRLANITTLCRLRGLLDYHPYDLSGGEQQRAALAKILLLRPKIILLDEPTKGFDAEFKQVFAGILKKLATAGAAVVIVSHDVEFCAEHADRCALFFDGSIVSEGPPLEFFSGNTFYTTAANRIARELIPDAITARDVISALGGKTKAPRDVDIDVGAVYIMEEAPGPPTLAGAPSRLSGRRMLVAVIPALLLIATMVVAALNWTGFSTFISGGNEAVAVADEGAPLYFGIMLAFALAVIALVLVLTLGREKVIHKPVKQKLSKRTIAAAAVILLAIPLTIWFGMYYLGDRRYYFIAMLIILETMIPFALVFESRKPQARELVTIAVMCAIAVAGRAAFFMLPQFKPVVAIVIVTGVAFGGEAGFLVGAITGFVSNFFFGQGPMTPWQMFAFGIIGFLAGVLFRKGLLGRGRVPLAVFGGLATFVVYGGIMNPAMVMTFQPGPVREMFLLAYLQGIPIDLVHSAATVTFLLIISQPMLEKLDRIKVKYGLML